MMKLRDYSRWQAATAHLAISATIAAATLLVMLFVWYPPPLFAAMGGYELVILIVGVDVVIGPLLTLIVFNPRKKELLFDLLVIATLQLGALFYGVYAMHAGRPVVIAFVENRFAVVTAAELENEAIAEGAAEEFRSLSQTGPRWVFINMPTDPQIREKLLFAGTAGLGAQHLPKYYATYAAHQRVVAGSAYPLNRLPKLNEADQKRLQDAIASSGRAAEKLGYLPIVAKLGVMTTLIDTTTGDVIGIVPISPISGS